MADKSLVDHGGDVDDDGQPWRNEEDENLDDEGDEPGDAEGGIVLDAQAYANEVALQQEQLAVVSAEDAVQQLLQEAYRQLPQTLLHLEDPVRLHLPPNATEGDRMEALAPYISPLIQSQADLISDRPVVTSTDKILNAVLPPRTFAVSDDVNGTQLDFVQCVRRVQASRKEIEELKQMFEFKLRECKARMIGICPVRSAIFEMLADELLRQVTIDQPERGLLLRRIRDEARMTFEAYQSLHAAASQYGSRKLLEGARGVPEMQAQIAQLTIETTALHKEVKRLEARQASLLRCVEEQIATDTKRHNEEKAFLENSRKRLQQHLENVKQMQEQERRAMMGDTAAVA